MICSRPLGNSARLRQRESTEYARATFSGSRVFQPSSARRTFCTAVSAVNGGRGGRELILICSFSPSGGLQQALYAGLHSPAPGPASASQHPSFLHAVLPPNSGV